MIFYQWKFYSIFITHAIFIKRFFINNKRNISNNEPRA